MLFKDTEEICPLCISDTIKSFGNEFLICGNCDGIFRKRSLLLCADEEKKRYQYHNNDVNDLRYREFVRPVTDAVIKAFPVSAEGLDFGAGTGPVTAKVLEEYGYKINLYDPFFHNHPEALLAQYDFIICCEVAEHFYNPAKEFLLLKKILKKGGSLFIMTHIYDNSLDFAKWYYKNDKTHVFIYQEHTLEWIKNHYEFTSLAIDKRLITFAK